MGEIRIDKLAHRPEHVASLVDMLHREWGMLENWSDPERLTKVIEDRVRLDAAPLALIALDGDRLAGSASIKVRELAHYADKEFWVGDVIVAADQRGRGIGELLMRAIVDEAHRIGIIDLFLYTPDQERYYQRLGWQTVGRDPANGEDNAIMRYVG